MFDVFLYLFVLTFVFWFIGSCPHAEFADNELAYLVDRALDYAWFEEELLEIANPRGNEWNDLTSAQLRSLCKLYAIPCSKRGRVNQNTIAQLMEVA